MRGFLTRLFLAAACVGAFSAAEQPSASARPADWDCAQTPFFTPHIVPDGELSVLNSITQETLPEDPSVVSTYKLGMVKILPGQFKLGSPASEAKRERFEGPVQDVTIGYAFEIGQYEVTFDDWDTCLAGGGCDGYRPEDQGWGRGARPVINISWNDTQTYMRWLNSVTGLNYRLPSEAEWEYAARAGTVTPFYTGRVIDPSQANFNGQFPYLAGKKGIYREKTLDVGTFDPNPWGLYDVAGNVFEWTQDCWSPSHKGAPNDGSARLDGDCQFRIMKGGSWVAHAFHIRTAKRTRYTTDFRYEDYGFRLARTLAE